MSDNWKRRPARNWKEVQYRLGQPKMVGTMITFAFIWMITGFEPMVAFGLSMGLLGMAGFFGGKYKHSDERYWKEDFDKDRDYDDDNDSNDSYYKDNYYDRKESRPRKEDAYNKYGQNSRTSNTSKSGDAFETNLPLHSKIIADAEEDIAHLRAASNTASDDLGVHLRAMVSNVEKVQKGLEEDPNKLSQVQRLFTYYLPSTNDLLRARGKAAAIGDKNKLVEIDSMIGRLEDAFEDFRARLNGEDARSVEIDIKLLDQSLDQEFSHIEKDKV